MIARPKHADIDKPRGSAKRKLRRWLRYFIKGDTRREVEAA